MSKKIDSFEGKYRFLSNFYEVPIKFRNVVWPTSEHIFQAAKTENWCQIWDIHKAPTPGIAKKLGRKVNIRSDWDDVRISVMKNIIKMKFDQNEEIQKKLLETGGYELIEGNTWNDTFWGVCRGKGENHLGKILMNYRNNLVFENSC